MGASVYKGENNYSNSDDGKELSAFLSNSFSQAFKKSPALQKLRDGEKKSESLFCGRMHWDFSIPMGLIVALMVSVGVISYVESEKDTNSPSSDGRIRNTIEVMVGIGAVGGLITTAFNIHHQNHYLRKQHSASYMSRWHSEEMIKSQKKFSPIREAIEQEDSERLEAILNRIKQEDSDEHDKEIGVILFERAVPIMNFFEQMAQDALTNVADSNYLKEFFWYIARRYYLCCNEIIANYRCYTGGTLCFAYFEDLIQRWEKEGRPLLIHRLVGEYNHTEEDA